MFDNDNVVTDEVKLINRLKNKGSSERNQLSLTKVGSIMLSGDANLLIKATEIDLYVLERGNSETVFSVLHQTYALEQSLYARDVVKWFMPCACIGIEL